MILRCDVTGHCFSNAECRTKSTNAPRTIKQAKLAELPQHERACTALCNHSINKDTTDMHVDVTFSSG